MEPTRKGWRTQELGAHGRLGCQPRGQTAGGSGSTSASAELPPPPTSLLKRLKQVAEDKEQLQLEADNQCLELNKTLIANKYNEVALYTSQLIVRCSAVAREVSDLGTPWYLNVYLFDDPTGPIRPELVFEPEDVLTGVEGVRLADKNDPDHSNLQLVFERLYVSELSDIDGVLQHYTRLERIQADIDCTSAKVATLMEDLAKSSIFIALYPSRVSIFEEIVTLGFKGTVYTPRRWWLGDDPYYLADGIVGKAMEWPCYREFLGLDELLEQFDSLRKIQLAINHTTSEIARLEQELTELTKVSM